MNFAWGEASRAKHGQAISGDTHIVLEQGSQLLASIIDGLGSGAEAARAAEAARKVIEEHPTWPLTEIIQQAHTALHQTRGAVIGILRLDQESHRASFIGVGNIGIHVFSKQPIKPISKSGILGFRLPMLLEMNYTYNPDDLFVLYSDGISARFDTSNKIDIMQSPQQIADFIMYHYGKTIDDVTVVTIRA